MQDEAGPQFGAFRLDRVNECLWRGETALTLTPKAFAVLCHLVAHANQLVTKDELFKTLWPGIYVSDGALWMCIGEIRKVLGDDPQAPQFLETMHRRGYRWIAEVVSSQHSVVSSQKAATGNGQLATPLVGRDVELAQLHKWWEKALAGERQLIFVTGEAGIGKTTLVEAFLGQVSEARDWRLETSSSSLQAPSLKSQASSLWIGRGQCIEHYGSGEAYLPVLEALARLGRASNGTRLVELLHRYAPTWLVQLPGLLDPDVRASLRRDVGGVTPERMLREWMEVLEVLTAETPVVVLLEDLHWSDYATVDLLSAVGRRREPARLLMLCTYRPVDVVVTVHPLKIVKQELQMHKRCAEVALTTLTEEAVVQYLAVRFGVVQEAREATSAPFPLRDLARIIHQRTYGNPLFMVNVADDLVTRGALEEREGRWHVQAPLADIAESVPESIRQIIEQQFERLSPEAQQVLEVASVVGIEFTVLTVGAVLATDGIQVEEQCEVLARQRHFVQRQDRVDFPNGIRTARYAFTHVLRQSIVYDRLSIGRRRYLHQQVGEQQEHIYGTRVGEIAAEVAVHFERAHDDRRALQYYQQAGQNALRRVAPQSAVGHLTKALALLVELPESPERLEQELLLQMAIGQALMSIKGYAAPGVEKAYNRARELCQQVGETPRLFPALRGLCWIAAVRGDLPTAQQLGEQLLSLAQRVQEPALLADAYGGLGVSLYWQGEVTLTRAYMEQGTALYTTHLHHHPVSLSLDNPQVVCLSYTAFALWYLGYPDQALQKSHETLTLAQELSHPHIQAWALTCAAFLRQFRREGQAAQKCAEALTALCAEHGFEQVLGWVGTGFQGWALADQGQREEGIVQLCQVLAAYRTTGAQIARPYFLVLLAELYGKGGQLEEGLDVLAEAFSVVEKTGERMYEAELYRVKGELTLKSGVGNPQSRVQKQQAKALIAGR